MIQSDLFGAGKPVWSTSERQARRALREQALAISVEMVSRKEGLRKYGVLYGDPPWRHEPWSRETGLGRSADRHYRTMPTKDIVAYGDWIKTIAHRHSVLWLWVTASMLVDGLEVMKAWGFEYKSKYVWDKEVAGNGRWGRDRHEDLLIGTRGRGVPCPAPGTQDDNVIRERKGRHSEKPDCVTEMIERYYPNMRKLELFARKLREGWDSWGDEVGAPPGLPSPSPCSGSPSSPSPSPLMAQRQSSRGSAETDVHLLGR